MRRPREVPVAPPPLTFLLWDGTDPVDSFALGAPLQRARWRNFLHRPDELASIYVSRPRSERPAVFQPCGPDGRRFANSDETAFSTSFNLDHWARGMSVFAPAFFSPHLDASLLAYSGHGIPGYMFAENGVQVASSRPVEIGAGTWHFVSKPRWNAPNLKVVLFSACRQLAGMPQQYLWSEAMRGAHPVRCLLSYRLTAPSAARSASIHRAFVANLRAGQPFVRAWKNAHGGSGLRRRWAALCYASAVNDRFDDWTRTGTFVTAPDPSTENILYFDSDHDYPSAGRPVRAVQAPFDCWLSRRGSAQKEAPWMLFAAGQQLDLHIEVTQPGVVLETGDELWIAAIQVRPDYGGPFDIRALFSIDATPDPLAGPVWPMGVMHDRTVGWTSEAKDVYAFIIGDHLPWLHRSSPTRLRIPIRLSWRLDRGGRLVPVNDHLPIFYFMLRLQKGDGRVLGIPTADVAGETIADQVAMIDDFQYAVFLIPG